MRQIRLFCGVAVMHALATSALLAQSSILPSPGGNASSQLQNRATIRVPGVDASNASRIRAGASFDPSRIRLNATANGSGSAAIGNTARLRAASSSRAAVEARRQNNAETQPANPDQGSQAGNRPPRSGLRLQTSAQFRTRLAEIERMRDVAVQRGDIELLRRADRLEHDLMRQRADRLEQEMRMRHSANQVHDDMHEDFDSLNRPRRAQAELQSPSRLRTAERFPGDLNGRFGGNADSAENARSQVQNSFQQGSQTAVRRGRQTQGEATARTRRAIDASERYRRRVPSTLNETRVGGSANVSSENQGNVQTGPASGSVNERAGAGGSADASPRQATLQGNASSRSDADVESSRQN